MNFYGKQSGEQHTISGRFLPLAEALWLAIQKASKNLVAERQHSKVLPEWVHRLCDKTTLTLFKAVVEVAPQENNFNARNYGCIIGILLRGIVFYVKEAPASLKKEGLGDLGCEQVQKLEKLAGFPQIFAAASKFFNKPISSKEALVDAGTEHLENKAEALTAGFDQIMLHLLGRPIEEQGAFLEGIAKGFKSFLNKEGEFSGNKRRLEAYLALFAYWPEIAEMQAAVPPKTRKDLLEWLEEQEEKQLFEDPKNFYYLCDEIGLDMTTPGHPHKSA